jgi:hypothetical protein
MKPKFQGGCSIATFSAVPHLITLLNIEHVRTNIIFKVMKAIGIPHHDGSPNYL